MNRLFIGVAVVTMSFAVTACDGNGGIQLVQGEQGQQVIVPQSDATAPTKVVLETVGLPTNVSVQSGGPTQSMQLTRGSSVLVYGSGEDPEGLQNIAIWGTVEFSCEDPNTGLVTKHGPGLAGKPQVEFPSSVTPGQSGYTGRYVSFSVIPETCAPGLKFVNSTWKVWAEATNFGGGATRTPDLEVVTPP